VDDAVTEAIFEEPSGVEKVGQVPLAHLSVELGHLYMEDYRAGPARLRHLMAQAAPWAGAAAQSLARQIAPGTARVSTCFLVDDYFAALSSPRAVVPQLVDAAAEAGLHIDYLARESAMVEADGVELARLVQDLLVADPPPGTNGSRPPPGSSGWLCNGQRSPQADVSVAMRRTPWRPPSENGANRHSIFIDVELWTDGENGRLWSCPYLAAIWQLLRLGVLRDEGRPVARPRTLPGELPDSWGDLPPITQLTTQPAAFSAFRTFSVLAGRFLPIEHSVRTILGQVDIARAIRIQVEDRAAAERPAPIVVAPELVDRIEYAFAGEPWR
jgi:hypothetical protein